LVKKATIYGGEIEDDDDPNSRLINSPTQSQSDRLKIQPNVVSQVYKEFIIPLTKEVEVEYLLKRLDD
jgi:chorismate mutase